MAKKNEAATTAEVAEKNKGGRTAYETPCKHHAVLERSGNRVRNARKALDDAEQAMFEKVVAALADDVKPSAITRSLGESHAVVTRLVKRAREEGAI